MSDFLSNIAPVLTFLKAVPDVLVGSLITVVGVLATNLGVARRHREQLAHTARESALTRRHEASESALDRKMQLRRDIYIPAIEAVYSALYVLGSMADPSVPRTDAQNKYRDAVAAISKVNGVAEADTVAAVGELLTQLLAMSLSLATKRAAIEQAHGQLVARNGIVDRAVQDHGRWVQTQTSLLFDGGQSKEKFDFVQNQVAFYQRQIDDWSQKRNADAIDLRVAQIDFLKSLTAYQPDASVLSRRLSIALRTELAFADGENLHRIEQALIDSGEKANDMLLRAISDAEDGLAAIRSAMNKTRH